MTLNFYTLGVIYLVYSFLGWVAETVVATIRGGRFANRGAAAGPFCFIYGTTGVLLAVSFGDLRTEPVYLFFACMMAATVMEWITAKLLELDRGVKLSKITNLADDIALALGAAGVPPQVVGLFRQKIQSERLCVPAVFAAVGCAGHGKCAVGQ